MKTYFSCCALVAALLLSSALAQPVTADENFSYYPSSTLDKRDMQAFPLSMGNAQFKSDTLRYRLSGQVITSAYLQFLCQRAMLQHNPGFKVASTSKVFHWLDDALSLSVTLEGPNAYGNKIRKSGSCYARIEGLNLLLKTFPY